MLVIKKILKDLPILINGFCVGLLTFGRPFGLFELILFALAAFSFVFYKNDK
jgi:hypothetical protein